MANKVSKLLISAAKTYEERNKIYGDTYKLHGDVVNALFPKGIKLEDPVDQSRFGVLTMIIGKLTRYAVNFNSGGHKDSLHDLQVYAAMLEELDDESAG